MKSVDKEALIKFSYYFSKKVILICTVSSPPSSLETKNRQKSTHIQYIMVKIQDIKCTCELTKNLLPTCIKLSVQHMFVHVYVQVQCNNLKMKT